MSHFTMPPLSYSLALLQAEPSYWNWLENIWKYYCTLYIHSKSILPSCQKNVKKCERNFSSILASKIHMIDDRIAYSFIIFLPYLRWPYQTLLLAVLRGYLPSRCVMKLWWTASVSTFASTSGSLMISPSTAVFYWTWVQRFDVVPKCQVVFFFFFEHVTWKSHLGGKNFTFWNMEHGCWNILSFWTCFFFPSLKSTPSLSNGYVPLESRWGTPHFGTPHFWFERAPLLKSYCTFFVARVDFYTTLYVFFRSVICYTQTYLNYTYIAYVRVTNMCQKEPIRRYT